MTTDPAAPAPGEARERILSTAYALFSRRRTCAVAVDEVIAMSSVAEARSSPYFPAKDDLVPAILARREQASTRDIVCDRAEQAGQVDPDGVAHPCHLLIKGSIVAAAERNTIAATRARTMPAAPLAAHRPSRDEAAVAAS